MTNMTVDNKTPKWRHQITMVDREELTIDGVVNLGSYDEKEIVMETEQGMLTIRGDSLNIKQLNLEQGCIIVDGTVKGLSYEDEIRPKKGLLDRFLK
ncbi:MAG TPA: sporulation protein YabP [Methylomusa anaerophila]|uniref:Spore protein YabP n=1 Tax=Methylomusa anaerophila TaxID=1930071 RepID=A0A348AJK0_9FIRM|nr:sporulation protein YabP [Methylomusa anaerophila]BBB91248.1 spore protein YabP [Methylomusa anaerophila]HML89758.1 sporulation protein YabP [Methylomusa anaerophila]